MTALTFLNPPTNVRRPSSNRSRLCAVQHSNISAAPWTSAPDSFTIAMWTSTKPASEEVGSRPCSKARINLRLSYNTIALETLSSIHADPPPPIVTEPSGINYATGLALGKGGFAICHRAERYEGSKPTGKIVALKIVKTKMEPAKLAQKVKIVLPQRSVGD